MSSPLKRFNLSVTSIRILASCWNMHFFKIEILKNTSSLAIGEEDRYGNVSTFASSESDRKTRN